MHCHTCAFMSSNQGNFGKHLLKPIPLGKLVAYRIVLVLQQVRRLLAFQAICWLSGGPHLRCPDSLQEHWNAVLELTWCSASDVLHKALVGRSAD